MQLQLKQLFSEFDSLQKIYGDPKLNSIYGAGQIDKPKLFFIFMNPTGKNISSNPIWNGIRSPWLGTKNIWKLFFKLNLITPKTFEKTQKLLSKDWTEQFCENLYTEISNNGVYVTNLAKCTQPDARPLSNKVFISYLELLNKELELIKPQKIITFGNQVSSIILGKNISVSNYISTNNIYPVYYPVGQGMRNMNKAIDVIAGLIKQEISLLS